MNTRHFQRSGPLLELGTIAKNPDSRVGTIPQKPPRSLRCSRVSPDRSRKDAKAAEKSSLTNVFYQLISRPFEQCADYAL